MERSGKTSEISSHSFQSIVVVFFMGLSYFTKSIDNCTNTANYSGIYFFDIFGYT